MDNQAVEENKGERDSGQVREEKARGQAVEFVTAVMGWMNK